MKKITLVWAYCLNNIGDDNFFYIISSLAKKQNPQAALNIITHNPLHLYTSPLKVEYFSKRNFLSLSKAIFSSHEIIIWPWSVFSGLFSSTKEIWFIFGITFLSKILFKKVIFLGIDYSPIENKFYKFLSILTLSLADKVYVRFKQNYLNLDRQHILSEKLVAMNDVTYSGYMDELVSQVGDVDQEPKTIWIVLSDLSYSFRSPSYETFLVFILNSLKSKGYRLKFLSLNMSSYGNKDLEYIKQLNEAHSLWIMEEQYISFSKWDEASLKDVIKNFKTFQYVVSNKLHSNILASLAGTSIISLSYHDKMRFLNEHIGLKKDFNFDIDFLSETNESAFQERFTKLLGEIDTAEGLNYSAQTVKLISVQNQKILEEIRFY